MITDFIKKCIFGVYNPGKRPIRDSSGKVIEDIRRKVHSKKVTERRQPCFRKRIAKGKTATKTLK